MTEPIPYIPLAVLIIILLITGYLHAFKTEAYINYFLGSAKAQYKSIAKGTPIFEDIALSGINYQKSKWNYWWTKITGWILLLIAFYLIYAIINASISQ